MSTHRSPDNSEWIDPATLPGFDEALSAAEATTMPPAAPPRKPRHTRKPRGFDAVGGMEDAKAEMRLALIEPLLDPEMAEHYGIEPGGRILLWGPPGCGKTIFARAAAEEARGATFLPIKVSDILGPHIGEDERNMTEIFRQARDQAPSVLFFDEIDALSPRRNDPHVWEAERRLTNSLLQELDGATNSRARVAVIGATNQPWLMDSAVRRAGRFDRLLYVGLPDLAARKAIWSLLVRSLPLGPDVCTATLAEVSAGLSGAEIAEAARRVRGIAFAEARARASVVDVRMLDFLLALRVTHPRSRTWLDEVPEEFARGESGVRHDRLAISRRAQQTRAERIEAAIDQWATGEVAGWEDPIGMAGLLSAAPIADDETHRPS